MKPELAEAVTQAIALSSVAVPRYLEETYWWAYVRPAAVRVFERQWLVNAILWGHFPRLRDAALEALDLPAARRVLQVACVYGDLTTRLADCLPVEASLDVIDILPVQLRNLRRKLADRRAVSLLQRDSAALEIADASHDRTLLFFLLHEQPEAVRRRTLAEAVRVTAPGGRIVIVDYHRPHALHPLRYLFRPVLALLEPYALDLWRHDITHWLPENAGVRVESKRNWFGGLYQRIVLVRE